MLEAAAERFGWAGAKPTAGRGLRPRRRHREGQLRRHLRRGGRRTEPATSSVVRVVTAFECGAVVNPDHLKNQVEGAIVMGLGGALFEAIELRGRQDPEPALRRLPRAALRRRAGDRDACCSTARTCRPRAPARRRSSPSPRPSATRSSTPPASGCAPCRSFRRDCRCHRVHRNSPSSTSPSSSIADRGRTPRGVRAHADESQDAIDPAEHGEIDEEHLHDGDPNSTIAR